MWICFSNLLYSCLFAHFTSSPCFLHDCLIKQLTTKRQPWTNSVIMQISNADCDVTLEKWFNNVNVNERKRVYSLTTKTSEVWFKSKLKKHVWINLLSTLLSLHLQSLSLLTLLSLSIYTAKSASFQIELPVSLSF